MMLVVEIDLRIVYCTAPGYQTAGDLEGCVPEACSLATRCFVAQSEETLLAVRRNVIRGNRHRLLVTNSLSGLRCVLGFGGCILVCLNVWVLKNVLYPSLRGGGWKFNVPVCCECAFVVGLGCPPPISP